MSIFTKLSLFFFFAFVVVASLPVMTDQLPAEKSALLSQFFVSLCMLFYILDTVIQSRTRRLQESETKHGKDPIGDLEAIARASELDAVQRELKSSEGRLVAAHDEIRAANARWEDAQRELKLRSERVAILESKLKTLDEDAVKGDQAVVQFLRTLQSKGRLIDFAMTDIHRIPDPQVGAVARIVHQGVRDLLQDYFEIVPLASESEGSLVAVKKDELAHAYRVLQDGGDDAPAQGRLVHRGWQTLSRKLPRSIHKESEDKLRVLAPAEIDARTNYA